MWWPMKTTKLLVSLTESLKAKRHTLRIEGYTASSCIPAVLEGKMK